MPSSKTLLAAALGALALTGAGAPAASADSISYVKNGNVWLTTPDGSRHFQVTTTGGYASASQSDDGTIAAIKGQNIHRLDRFGTVLSNFSTPVSDGTNDSAAPYTSHFIGPFDADISDDGTKVSYSFYWQYWMVSGYSGYHMLRQGVGISRPDRVTAWSEPGYGYLTGWLDASWYDNDTLVLGRESSVGQTDISLHNAGAAFNAQTPWFVGNSTLTDLREPAVNRQHTRVAFVGGSDSAPQLWVHRMNGEAPSLPTACHGWSSPAGDRFGNLTWSPNGDGLAWEEGDGIWLATGNTATCGAERPSSLLVAGATYPDWGPADVPTSRPAPDPGTGGGDGGAGGGGGGTGGTGSGTGGTGGTTTTTGTGGTTTTTGTGATSITSTPRADGVTGGVTGGSSGSNAAGAKGLTFPFACGGACTITGKVALSSKVAKKLNLKPGLVVAGGRVKLTKKGRANLVVTPTAAGRKALAKLKGRKLAMKVTIKEGRKTRRVTRSVTLR